MTVSAISGDTAESGTSATFSVVLTSQPSADVTIPILSLDTSEGASVGGQPDLYRRQLEHAQTVTVTGVDDALVDGDITYTVEVGDPAGGDYDALTNADTADVSLTNLDDDSAGVTVSAISGNTAESGTTATFTVVLDQPPSAASTWRSPAGDTTDGTVSRLAA